MSDIHDVFVSSRVFIVPLIFQFSLTHRPRLNHEHFLYWMVLDDSLDAFFHDWSVLDFSKFVARTHRVLITRR